MTIDELLTKLLAYCLASIIVTIIAKTIITTTEKLGFINGVELIKAEEKALATINKYKEAVARNVDIQKHLSETKSYLECTKYINKNGD